MRRGRSRASMPSCFATAHEPLSIQGSRYDERMSRCLGLLALALTAAACGPGSYGELRDELVGASCEWARRCGYVGASDRASCPVDDSLSIFHDTTMERAAPSAVDVPATIEAGRMRYDSVNADGCL